MAEDGGSHDRAAGHLPRPVGLGVDLLFLAGDCALEAVLARAEHPLGEMKRQLRAARVQFFVFRTKHELRDLGYEDFVEALGLPFLGACR